MVAIDAQRGLAQRSCQVREAGVQPHHLLRASQHRGHLAHLQKGRYVAITTGGDVLGQRLLFGPAPAHHRRPAQFQHALAHRHPVPLGPQLFLAAGVGDQEAIRRARLPGGQRRADAEVGRCRRQRIAQVRGNERAAALHGVGIARDRCLPLVQPGGQRLADAVAVVAGHRSSGLACPQRALEQALQVQHQVIGLGAQRLAQLPHCGPGVAAGQLFSPLAPGHGQHAAHAGVHLRNGAEGRLHQPVDLRAGVMRQDVGHHGLGVHHVTHRRGLDDEDARRAQGLSRSLTSCGFNNGSLYILNWR